MQKDDIKILVITVLVVSMSAFIGVGSALYLLLESCKCA